MSQKITIREIRARQVYDSRANPTVEVDVITNTGCLGRGTVPSGASTGKYEAHELRDTDSDRLGGRAVFQAVHNVNNVIAPKLIGHNVFAQAEIDALVCEIDGTKNKSRMGANAILGVSMAVAHAAAAASGQPLFKYLGDNRPPVLPMPMIQIIGGGAHADNAIDLQDFLVIPVGADTFAKAIEMVVTVYMATRTVFQKYGKPVSVADEGGFWPTFSSNTGPLTYLMEGIEKAGYRPGIDIAIALDIAASEFYEAGTYHLRRDGKQYAREAFIDYVIELLNQYPIISIEDPLDEDDWNGWQQLMNRLKKRKGGMVQVIGDDLFTTNISLIRNGVEKKVGNSVLIKMNQIGTITETLDAITFTQQNGYLPVISARSGETEDVTIAHIAVATGAGQLKVGAVARTDRTAKWNEVIRIEEMLGKAACFPGRSVFDPIMK